MEWARSSTIASVCVLQLLMVFPVRAATYDFTIDGVDAIFLAGRTDVTIPALNATDPSFPLGRHGYVLSDFVLEQFPGFIPVAGGDNVFVADPAVGGVHFYNTGYLDGIFFGPEGDLAGTSTLSSLGGISGYQGTLGALTGVFLDNSFPSSGPAPATLDFTSAASRNFASISPLLGQVFFIGNGVTDSNVFQQFVAPAGATRLFLGIPDGFYFNGPPGAYEDNDGSYQIQIGINQLPVVPLPSAAWGGLALLGAIGISRFINRRRAVA